MSQNNLKSILADGRVFSHDDSTWSWTEVTDTYPYVTGNTTSDTPVLNGGEPETYTALGGYIVYVSGAAWLSGVWRLWRDSSNHVRLGPVDYSDSWGWWVDSYNSSRLYSGTSGYQYLTEMPSDGDVVHTTINGFNVELTISTIPTILCGDSATDEAPTTATAKIYRKRGDVLREFKPMQDNPEAQFIMTYNDTADELKTNGLTNIGDYTLVVREV